MDLRIIISFLTILTIIGCNPSSKNDLETLLHESDHPAIQKVIENKDSFQVQIIYTQVNRSNGGIILNRHSYNLDTNEYFYPASTVKLPVAILALEKLTEFHTQHPDITRNTAMVFDSLRPSQSSMVYDSCSASNYPTIGSLIEQVFAISDNNAYNRLFEFLGQQYINEKLYDKKLFTNSRILTRVGVSGFDSNENTHYNPISFITETGDTLKTIDARSNAFTDYPEIKHSIKGRGYYDDQKGEVINKPFDMGQKNFINLADLDRIIKCIIYPDVFPPHSRFQIREQDYQFLLSAMGKVPRKIPCYADHENKYYDSYVKFFMHGDQKNKIPDHLKIKNKVGVAYGFLTDIAHIMDTNANIEFFLSATILVNKNQIYNDGNYEYDEIGIPFMAELGRIIYEYEKNGRNPIK